MAGGQLRWSIGACAINSAALTATLTVILGGLVAADRPLSLALVAASDIALGLLHGVLNGIEFARQPSIVTHAVGIAVALFVVVLLVAGHVTTVRATWARVAVRVAGSWIAASGLLMLGRSLREMR